MKWIVTFVFVILGKGKTKGAAVLYIFRNVLKNVNIKFFVCIVVWTEPVNWRKVYQHEQWTSTNLFLLCMATWNTLNVCRFFIRICIFSLIIEGAISVGDFLTIRANTTELSRFLLSWKLEALQQKALPTTFVTDFSWPILRSILEG